MGHFKAYLPTTRYYFGLKHSSLFRQSLNDSAKKLCKIVLREIKRIVIAWRNRKLLRPKQMTALKLGIKCCKNLPERNCTGRSFDPPPFNPHPFDPHPFDPPPPFWPSSYLSLHCISSSIGMVNRQG
jgi:hypothetical protein